MYISLIAMSGSGKSYWAAKLADSGFKCFSCDDMIGSKLAPELRRPDGTTLTMGEWMGFPYQPNYFAREAKYLAYEKEVLREIFSIMHGHPSNLETNLVIDTTGSVIYAGKEILDKLRRHATVVHLATPAEIQDQMLQAYIAKPRPVLWKGKFVKMPHEKNEEALARCYSELVSYREGLYKSLAHITVDYGKYRRKGFRVKDFLDAITASK